VPEEKPPRILHIVGVKFRPAGSIQELDSGAEAYVPGDLVLADTDRGPRIGQVAVGSMWAHSHETLRRVVRRANAEEARGFGQRSDKDREAYLYCKERIRERRLPMKLIQAEVYPATQKASFFFASEERLDFRDLIRDLSQHLRLRIELRQIGVRDEAKLVGGIGDCGRELCCTTWLPAFMPVSIKMAKDQGIALNPSKLSGQCGRLKCCLVYEHETYKEMSKGLPKMGKRVHTPAGPGKVIELDVLAQRVRVLFDQGGTEVFPGGVVTPLLPAGQSSNASSEKTPLSGDSARVSEISSLGISAITPETPEGTR
jgi:cell fate regulator YaaT (PSP1 superfamily)